jgi:protease-4
MQKVFKLIFLPLIFLWRALAFTRAVVANLIFLALIVLAVVFIVRDRGPRFPDRAALVVDPAGSIVEQKAETLLSNQLLGETGLAETLLQDVVDAIDQAGGDERIEAILLDLDKLQGAGLSKLQEIGAALKRFRDTGKPVIAAADIYTQRSYFLAAHADRVYLDPMGAVMLTGFGVYQNYFKTALDKLLVRFHVFTAGSYKSALDPFIRNDMSASDRTANSAVLTVLWDQYTAGVARQRGMGPAAIDDYINRFPEHLAAAGGDAATLALEMRLVDGLKSRDQVRQELMEIVGEDARGRSFNQVKLSDYAAARRETQLAGDQKVGVVVARGVIQDGTQPAGTIGGDSLSAIIRKARGDEAIKALVVRIDSPGGSAFASERIRREIELTRGAGKPVIVSMSSVAASGGYWIASAADEIWAYPTTITGSIGVFGAFPTFEKSLKTLGISNDGVGTTRMADAFNPSRPLNELVADSLAQLIENSYRVFIRTVAEGRQMPAEAVKAVAEGRIWAGQTAAEIGLVDKLGYLHEAIESAARRAGLDRFRTVYLEQELTPRERILKRVNELVRIPVGRMITESVPGLAAFTAAAELGALVPFTDARGLYAYCPTCVDPLARGGD